MGSVSQEATSWSDVFVSYKREERLRVAPIIDRLRELGLTVWFDAALNPGVQFDEEILEQLGHAQTHLVCWTVASVESRWVRAEAALSASKNILLPVFLEPCQPKPPFNIDHIEDLSDWNGQRDHFGWQKVLARIGQLTGRGDALKRWETIGQRQDSRLLREFVSSFPEDSLAVGARRQIFALELAATKARLVEELGAPGSDANPEEDYKEEISRLRRQLEESKANLARATSDFRTTLIEYEGNLGNAKQTNSALNEDLAARDTATKGIRDELNTLKSEKLTVSRKLSAAEQLLSTTVSQRDSLKAELDTLKAQTAPTPAADSKSGRGLTRLEWVSLVGSFLALALLVAGLSSLASIIILLEIVIFTGFWFERRISKKTRM